MWELFDPDLTDDGHDVITVQARGFRVAVDELRAALEAHNELISGLTRPPDLSSILAELPDPYELSLPEQIRARASVFRTVTQENRRVFGEQ